MSTNDRANTVRALARGIVTVALIGGGVGVVSTIAATVLVALVVNSEGFLVMPLALSARESFVDWLVLASLLAGGGLVVGLIRWWNRPSSMQGPANVIAAVHGLDRLMPTAPGFRTTLASLVSMCSGASVGQYGPLAHLGALLGQLIANLTGGDPGRRNIAIACGAAAAISTAFNAPIAGIVFAHELILRHFSLRAFAPVTVAASIGYVFTNYVVPHDPIFELLDPVYVYPPEYLYFACIGIAGGLIAVVYMRAIFACEGLARASRVPEIARPALCGLLIALIAVPAPEILGVGQGFLGEALAGFFLPTELGVILAAKLIATALCLGFGFVGGVFSPALLIGVAFGALCGTSLEMAFPAEHSDIVIYAACGMVAVVSPVIGAPLTTILIIFELTRNYDITTAAMLTAVMSNLVSYRVFGRSYFDQQLARGGYDLSMGREKLVLSVRSLKDLTDRYAPAIDEKQTVASARDLMIEHGATELAVIDDSARYLGMMSLVATADTDPDISLGEVLNRDALPMHEGLPVWRAMETIEQRTADHFAVVTDSGHKFVGMVSRRDIVSAYLSVSRSVRREQNEIV